MAGSYDDKRHKWALMMQEKFAMDIYMNYWQASRDDIEEIDKIGNDEGNDGQKLAQRIDFSGIDKIIRAANADIHIAQRFRANSNEYSVGFTLRSQTGGDARSERDRLLDNYRNRGNYPRIYSLGIALENTRSMDSEGFERFYLIDLERFLAALDSGDIEPVLKDYPNGDGSALDAFSIGDIASIGAIEEAWGEQDLRSIEREERIYRQSSLVAFGDGGVACGNCGRALEDHVRVCYYCGKDRKGGLL